MGQGTAHYGTVAPTQKLTRQSARHIMAQAKYRPANTTRHAAPHTEASYVEGGCLQLQRRPLGTGGTEALAGGPGQLVQCLSRGGGCESLAPKKKHR